MHSTNTLSHFIGSLIPMECFMLAYSVIIAFPSYPVSIIFASFPNSISVVPVIILICPIDLLHVQQLYYSNS